MVLLIILSRESVVTMDKARLKRALSYDKTRSTKGASLLLGEGWSEENAHDWLRASGRASVGSRSRSKRRQVASQRASEAGKGTDGTKVQAR